MADFDSSIAFAAAFIGLPGSMKTRLAQSIGDRLRAPVLTLSQFIPEESRDGERVHPVVVAEQLNRQHGGGFLMERALSTVPTARVVVIDGARHPDQISLLRRRCRDVVVVHVEHPRALRHDRVRASRRGLPDIDPEQLDDLNLRAGLDELIGCADTVIDIATRDPAVIEEAEQAAWRYVKRSLRDGVLDWLTTVEFPAADVVGELDDAYFVGGVVRDFLLVAQRPSDVDIVVTGDLSGAQRLLGERFPLGRTRFGSARFIVSPEWTIDIWSPSTFESGFDSLDDMLRHFDLSIDAIGLRLADGDLVDPTGGLADLNDGSMSILPDRWLAAPPHEAARLCLRTLRLARATGLTLVNHQLLVPHLPSLDAVADHDVESRVGPRSAAVRDLATLASTGRVP